MVTRGPRRWPRWLVQVVLGLMAIVVAIGGVVAVGNVARDAIQPSNRYLVPFAEVECPAPVGQTRAEFLEEVRYLGKLPKEVNIVDPALADRLRDAFAAHRRVARVNGVHLQSPKHIAVDLTFRP